MMAGPIAATLAGAGAAAGWRAGWLTSGGAIAALVVGTSILAGAGIGGGLMLGCFFASGSLLTYRSTAADQPPDRGRTAGQVFANGGSAAVGALLVAAGFEWGWAVIGGALATAQSDTWATEIGMRSGATPRMVTTGRPAKLGTSGAVSIPGSLAGAAGSALMAALFAIERPWSEAVWVAAAGVTGVMADSVLGATVQGTWQCEACDALLDADGSHCGARPNRVRGLAWVDNDVVNAAATLVGAGVAAAGWAWIR